MHCTWAIIDEFAATEVGDFGRKVELFFVMGTLFSSSSLQQNTHPPGMYAVDLLWRQMMNH